MEKHFLVVILRPSIIICKYSQHVSNKTQLRIAYFDSKQVFTMHAKDIFDQISCKFYFIDLYLIECSIVFNEGCIWLNSASRYLTFLA